MSPAGAIQALNIAIGDVTKAQNDLYAALPPVSAVPIDQVHPMVSAALTLTDQGRSLLEVLLYNGGLPGPPETPDESSGDRGNS
jgi:hypothetical protein